MKSKAFFIVFEVLSIGEKIKISWKKQTQALRFGICFAIVLLYAFSLLTLFLLFNNLFCIIVLFKPVSAIFYQIFVFPSNYSPSKTMKSVFYFIKKSSFHSRDIQTFVIFSLPFHTFQIQKDKWKWNNLWSHELACIDLQMQFLK